MVFKAYFRIFVGGFRAVEGLMRALLLWGSGASGVGILRSVGPWAGIFSQSFRFSGFGRVYRLTGFTEGL